VMEEAVMEAVAAVVVRRAAAMGMLGSEAVWMEVARVAVAMTESVEAQDVAKA